MTVPSRALGWGSLQFIEIETTGGKRDEGREHREQANDPVGFLCHGFSPPRDDGSPGLSLRRLGNEASKRMLEPHQKNCKYLPPARERVRTLTLMGMIGRAVPRGNGASHRLAVKNGSNGCRFSDELVSLGRELVVLAMSWPSVFQVERNPGFQRHTPL